MWPRSSTIIDYGYSGTWHTGSVVTHCIIKYNVFFTIFIYKYIHMYKQIFWQDSNLQ